MPKNNKYKVIKEDTNRSWRNAQVGDVLELADWCTEPDLDGDLYFRFPNGHGGYYRADCVERIDAENETESTVTVKVDASGLRGAIEGVSLRHAALSLVVDLVKNARFPEMGVPTAAHILAHAKAFEDYLRGGEDK